MKFENLKTLLGELEEKGYVKNNIYEDHIIVHILRQTNDLIKIVTNKIEIICETLEDCDYDYYYREEKLIIMNTNKLINILEEANNYEQMKNELNNDEISYISNTFISGGGIKKRCGIWLTNSGGDDDCRKTMKEIIKYNCPAYITIEEHGGNLMITTPKATNYEKKKKCCQEIKIEEDFNEIFEKYL